MVQLTLHAKAVNLARRMTVQNENDMMQESFVDDEDYDMPKQKYTREFCSELSKHLMHEKALPQECAKFEDILASVKRRDTDTSHPTQWMS